MTTKRYKVADNSAITIGGFIVKQNQIIKDGLMTDQVKERLLKMGKIAEAKEAKKKDQAK
jgi:hypothetical protein